MKILGILLIVGGTVWGLIAFNMSTAVTTGGQRIGSGEYSVYVPSVTVNNIGLIEERRNHLLGASVTAVIGAVFIAAGVLRRPNEQAAAEEGQRQCPHCAEFVKAEAKVCRFCQRDLPPLEDLAAHAAATRQRIEELAALDPVAARVAEDMLPKGTCPSCEKVIPLVSLECKHCKALFGPGSAWAVRPSAQA